MNNERLSSGNDQELDENNILNSRLVRSVPWRAFSEDRRRIRDSAIASARLSNVPGRDCFEDPRKNKDTVMSSFMHEEPEESFCLFNKGELRARIGLIQDYFLPKDPRKRVAYAVKANPQMPILETLIEAGLDTFDCASPNEIERVRSLDSDADVLFNHPIKTRKDIHSALDQGVCHFTVQSQREIDKVLESVFSKGRPRTPVELAVRMQTLNEQAAINLSTKFGATKEDSIDMLRFLHSVGNVSPGISVHTGSQNEAVDTFVEGIEYMTSVAKKSGKVHTVNVGGGIPVNYHRSQHFDIREYLQVISQSLAENVRGILSDHEGRIIIELGRAIVADCIDLIIPVLDLEERGGKLCAYINDGVFTSFSDAVIHNWKHPFRVLGKDGKEKRDNKMPFTLFGRTCDSGDVLHEVELSSDVEVGDFIHIPSAGAYMDSQATYFNGFKPPKYVAYNI